MIAATTGTSPQGFVKQGGTYRVYANVTDLPAGAGAASGVDASSITANVTNVTTGQTAVSLAAVRHLRSRLGLCVPVGRSSPRAIRCPRGTRRTPSQRATTSARAAPPRARTCRWTTRRRRSRPCSRTRPRARPAGSRRGGYRVYANVTDLPSGAGAASGVNASSLAVDVSSITTGQTAVALSTSGCPCTVGGTTLRVPDCRADREQSAVCRREELHDERERQPRIDDESERERDRRQHGARRSRRCRCSTRTATARSTRSRPPSARRSPAYTAGTAPWTLGERSGRRLEHALDRVRGHDRRDPDAERGERQHGVGSFTVALAANAHGIRDLAGNQSSFGATAVADKAARSPTDVQC